MYWKRLPTLANPISPRFLMRWSVGTETPSHRAASPSDIRSEASLARLLMKLSTIKRPSGVWHSVLFSGFEELRH